jgi:putative ABC transport system permease protein
MRQDLRLAVRSVTANPWFSSAVIAILACGIGINTTVFSLVNAVLFKPLPIPGGARLVTVASQRRGTDNQFPLSFPDYLDLRDQNRTFDALQALSQSPATLSDTGIPPQRYRHAHVTTGLFDLLQTHPVLGRNFRADDGQPGAAPVVLISYDVWRTRYGLAPGVVGRAVRVNETLSTIIGVMPAGFMFPSHEEVWTPLVPSDSERIDRGARSLLAIGLVKPGASAADVRLDLDAIMTRAASSHPDTNKDITTRVLTFNERYNGGQIRLVFLLMLGAVGCVLLIACANVANMLLSRALGRMREVAIRAALGASRWRIVRQLLVESLLLSALGGLAGLGIAAAGVRAFSAAVANVPGKPYWIDFSIDYLVLAYCAALCLGSAVVFGLSPAIRSARADVNGLIKDGRRTAGGRQTSRLSSALVVVQFALAVVLLAAGGLFVRGWFASQTINAFVPADRILATEIELPSTRYPDADSRQRFWDALLDRVAVVPGVSRAALTSSLPGLGVDTRHLELETTTGQRPEDRPRVGRLAVTPDYLELIGVSLTQGRAFDGRDGRPGGEVAIVASDFAARFWPHQDPLGRRFRFNEDTHPGPWLTVVGVAGVVNQDPQAQVSSPVVYVPQRQEPSAVMQLLLRSAGAPSDLSAPLRREVQALDQDLPLVDVQTVRGRLDRAWWFLQVFGTVFLVFAAVALLMSVVGIYAVVAQNTSRRTREIGIRMALGATASRVLRLVLTRGAMLLAAGMVVGLVAAFALTRLMTSLLFAVSASDPVVFAVVPGILCGAGLAACWIPARRAASLHPAKALRED